MKHEVLKLFRDPLWRLENLYKIVDKKASLKTIQLNNAQRQVVEHSNKKRIALLKARQFGFTTLGVLQCLDRVLWNENTTACILAHEQKILDKIFKIVRIAYDNLPPSCKPKLDRGEGSKYELRFPEVNSTIYTTLSVRGGTIHHLHVSEAAFIPEDRIHGTLQAVPIDGKVTFETTPNGLNHFHDLWNDLENGIEKLFFPWFFNPEYRIATNPLLLTPDEIELIQKVFARYQISLSHEQIAFRRFKIREAGNSLSKFLAEYPEDDQTCFLSSGSNPFDLGTLKTAQSVIPDSQNYRQYKGIKICKEPNPKKHYVIGADVAEGVRSDYSHADVFCVEDWEQVAQFRSNMLSPGEFAEVLGEMGKLYSANSRYPLLIVERNNHGHAVILKLTDSVRYPNLWRDDDEKIGHRTTVLSRPILIDLFIEAVRSKKIKINFRETIAECLTLVDNNGKIEADEGKHDDAVIAAALSLKALVKSVAKLDLYENLHKKIRS